MGSPISAPVINAPVTVTPTPVAPPVAPTPPINVPVTQSVSALTSSQDSSSEVVHTVMAAGWINGGAMFTSVIATGNQPGVMQFASLVVTSRSETVASAHETTPAEEPSNEAEDTVQYVLDIEPLNADSILSPDDFANAPATDAPDALRPVAGDSVESFGMESDTAAAPVPARGTLLAAIATNFEVLDRALQTALEEIENLGGELVVWLDESDTAAWATAGAVILLAGGGIYRQRRRNAQHPDASLQELPLWMFTYRYEPVGRL